MDPVILTPRLKLTLVTHVERGSPELEWCHLYRSDEKATFWSLHGISKSVEDTEKVMKGILPVTDGSEAGDKAYRVVYAVHKILEPAPAPVPIGESSEASAGPQTPTEFIGVISLKSSNECLPLPEEYTSPDSPLESTHLVETAYSFLPAAWNKGYATESINAMLETFSQKPQMWKPFTSVYVRALVNLENLASQRVMEKVGMKRRGVYVWRGEAIWIGGRWREEDSIVIFGKQLVK